MGVRINGGFPNTNQLVVEGKMPDTGAIRNKAVYLAIGVNMSKNKEVLGLWIVQTEGAKFWLQRS